MSDIARLAMQVVVSVVLLAAGIWLLVTKHDESTKKIAAGWVGLVAGYWLK